MSQSNSTLRDSSQDRALRRAENDLETAFLAVHRAVDSHARRLGLLANFPYTSATLRARLAALVQEGHDHSCAQKNSPELLEDTRRQIVNARLLLDAWAAVVEYEALSPPVRVTR